MNVLISILSIIVMIILHEYGHFIAARICKVPVYEFAVGFGPKIFSRKGKKETLWSIRAIPLGGFCSFDDLSKSGNINGVTDIALERIPIWKKIFICFMGPLFNVILGFVICLFCVFSFGVQDSKNIVSDFSENTVNIQEYLEIGDEIIEIDGIDVSEVNDTKLREYLTNDFEGDTAHVKVIKANTGDIEEYDIKPYYSEEDQRYFLGFKLTLQKRTPGLFEGILFSVKTTYNSIVGIFDSIGGLITGKYSVKDTYGIVGCVEYMSENATSELIENFFLIATYISVNLGVMNLLPIPPLDGFKIFQGIIEIFTKKKMNEKAIVILTTVSFGIIMILTILLTVGDITRIVNNVRL